MNMLAFFRSTLLTFPVFPLNCPLMILTLSPFFSVMFLAPYFFASSFESLDETSLFLMWRGALYWYFLCFFGFLLAFQYFENVFIQSRLLFLIPLAIS